MDNHTTNCTEERANIYGDALPLLEETADQLLNLIEEARIRMKEETGMDPVEHCLYRIKSDQSMREKCRRRGLPETAASALEEIQDAVGIRIVVAFVNDIYRMRDAISRFPDTVIVTEKDYVKHAKPNGYRSYHVIIRFRDRWFAEIQIRTISMDTWAALEHHMKYKKNLKGNLPLIVSELKRCADELASTDLSMQTIRDMILEDRKEEKDNNS